MKKTMTCKEMGGECDLSLSAITSDEMVEKMDAHIKKEHPEVAKQMENMSSEEREKWDTEFHKKWEKAPELK